MDARVKFGDLRLNRSQDVQTAHFVMDDDERRRSDRVVIGRTSYGALLKNGYTHKKSKVRHFGSARPHPATGYENRSASS